MIYLLIGSALEIVTIISSSIAYETIISKVMHRIGKKGYRINPNSRDQAFEILNNNNDELYKVFNKAKAVIPVFNIIYMNNLINKTVKKTINTFEQMDMLVKQNEKDKKEYNKIITSYQEFKWVLQIEKEDNNYDKQDEYIKVPKHNLVYDSIGNDFDIIEVEALANSNTYNYEYKVGLIDKKPVAIIGIYDHNIEFGLIKLPSSKTYQVFKEIKDIDRSKYHYEVYQYALPYDKNKFNNCLDNIYKLRKKYIEEIRKNTQNNNDSNIAYKECNKILKKNLI